MSEKLVLGWELSDDKKMVRMEAKGNTYELDFDLVEEIIDVLGACRYEMDPPSVAKRPMQDLRAMADPNWAVDTDAMGGGAILSIRDMRFGWLHYTIPPEKTKALAADLVKCGDGSALGPPPPRRRMN
jgi:hypothetical protein